MKSTELKFPTDLTGRVVGTLFLILLPLVTIIPYAAVPVSLTQDLVLRWAAAAVFLLCAGVYLQPSDKSRSLRLDFSNLLLLILSAWVLLSVKNSKEAFESFYSFRGFMAMVLWWFSLRMVWQRWPGLFPAFQKVFLGVAIFAAAWLCLYMAGRAMGIPFFRMFIERKGFFINENIGAGFLGMALLWGALRKLHRQPMPGWCLGLLFLGWAITQSRGAFVAMVAVIFLYLLLHMREIEERLSGWKAREWVLFGVSVVLALACSSYTIKKLFDALEVDPRALNRWELWQSGFDMAMSQPLLGFGPGTFPDVFPAYQPAAFWNAFVPAAHNEYLQTTIECGLPALLLTVLFLWYILRETGSRVLRTSTFKEAAQEDLVSEYAFYLVLLEAIHNTVDFTFHEWSHRLVLLGFVTYALSRKKMAGDVEVTLNLSRRAYLAGATLLALFVLWTLGFGGYKDYMAKLYSFNATNLYEQGNLDLAEAFGNRSLGLRADYMKPWNLLGAVEDVRGERASNSRERKKHLELAAQYFTKAAGLSPYSLEPIENQVRLMMVQGRLEDALELQDELVEKAPAYPPAYIQRGDILMKLGRAQDAIASAQKAVDLDQYFIPGQLLKANAMEAIGKKKDAIQVYKTIEEILEQVNNPEYAERMKEIAAHIRKLQGQP